MNKELEQVKEKLERLTRLGNEPNQGISRGNLLAQEALTALEAYEARLDSDEFMDKAAEEGMIESREKACRYSYQQNNKRLSND